MSIVSTTLASRPRRRARTPRTGLWRLSWGLPTALLAGYLQALPAGERVLDMPGAGAFVREMSQRYGYPREELEQVLAEAEVLPAVVEAISRPAEAKPWYDYRRIFLTPERIEGGVAFWRENRASLEKASGLYGVPPEVIIAIIGVETRYGRNTGSYRVVDSLGTLAFGYPKRAEFFRRELESFLVLTREEDISPLSPKGSYAGAMGIPQFMPSSYRRYAVDLDGDGRRDLWRDPDDAIGSVANYLRAHGWERGAAVALPATVTSADASQLVKAGLKPSLTPARLLSEGVRVTGDLPASSLGALIQLETREGYEYWVGLQNFYAISRYNHSPLYAMAVYQLAREIKSAYGGPGV